MMVDLTLRNGLLRFVFSLCFDVVDSCSLLCDLSDKCETLSCSRSGQTGLCVATASLEKLRGWGCPGLCGRAEERMWHVGRFK